MKRVNIVADNREGKSWAESLPMKQYIEVHFGVSVLKASTYSV